jgi:hypothetical protein
MAGDSMVVSVATGNKLLPLPHVSFLTQLQNVTDVIGFEGIVWLDIKNARKTMNLEQEIFLLFLIYF